MYFTKCFPWHFQGPPGTVHCYHNLTDCISYAVRCIPGRLCIYQSVLSSPFPFYTQSPDGPPFWQTSLCSWYLWVCFSFCLFIYIKFIIFQRNYFLRHTPGLSECRTLTHRIFAASGRGWVEILNQITRSSYRVIKENNCIPVVNQAANIYSLQRSEGHIYFDHGCETS